MSTRKNISEITTKELLETVGQSKPAVSFYEEVDKSLHDFIKEFKVSIGKTKIPNYVIFYNYMKWRPTGKKLSKISFFRNFNKYFIQKRNTHTRYYLLKNGTFENTKESRDEAKKYNKEYEEKIKKKTKKISGLRKKI